MNGSKDLVSAMMVTFMGNVCSDCSQQRGARMFLGHAANALSRLFFAAKIRYECWLSGNLVWTRLLHLLVSSTQHLL
jgi:hypothetical protein